MTSWNGNIFRVTGHLCGEFTGLRWIPTQRPVTWSFDVFFDLCLNKRLSKQSWGWWFGTPSLPLWRQNDAIRLCSLFVVRAVPYHKGWWVAVKFSWVHICCFLPCLRPRKLGIQRTVSLSKKWYSSQVEVEKYVQYGNLREYAVSFDFDTSWQMLKNGCTSTIISGMQPISNILPPFVEFHR